MAFRTVFCLKQFVSFSNIPELLIKHIVPLATYRDKGITRTLQTNRHHLIKQKIIQR